MKRDLHNYRRNSRRRRKPLLAVLLCLLVLAVAGCPTKSDPAKKVAALDGEAIYDLPAFKKANDDLKAWSDKRVEELKKEMEKKPDKEKAVLQRQFQLDLQAKTNDAFTKLRQRADGAVAKVAREKGALVVLDQKIVVYGVPEITDDVKKVFGETQETFSEADAIELPEEQDTSAAPVGYFDQTVVRALKVFQEADMEISNERRRLFEEMKEQLGAKPKPSEVQQMQKALQLRLEAFTEQKMAPLVKAVNDSVEDVAKAEGLSLVLDKQHVMYGGRNMTEQVVETFLEKVGSAGKAPATETSPTPAETPKAGG